MEEGKAEEKKNEDFDSDEEENEVETPQDELDKNLLDACRENRTDDVNFWLDKRANPLYEADGWNPLLWAACNGNEQIIRALIKHNAIAPYLNQKASNVDSDDKNKTNNDDETNDPFVKPKDARKVGKYTPLHWASYKGFYKVVWILLKEGMSALDIDMYGNTAVHQAAAAGQLKVLECFLSSGVDVDIGNARGHTPMDLADEANTKKLISKATKTKNCENPKCKAKFDFKNIRYYCS
jgi:ankyrin repeat protein